MGIPSHIAKNLSKGRSEVSAEEFYARDEKETAELQAKRLRIGKLTTLAESYDKQTTLETDSAHYEKLIALKMKIEVNGGREGFAFTDDELALIWGLLLSKIDTLHKQNIEEKLPVLRHIAEAQLREDFDDCDCVVDLEDGSPITACEKHPQGGSPKGKYIWEQVKAALEAEEKMLLDAAAKAGFKKGEPQ
jgi:hypothetical protein